MPERAAFGAVEDLSDVLVDVILGYECNVQCDYCSITPEMRRSNLSTREVVEELSRARALGMSRVAFGGGEPTIRKDLFPLVRYARDRGFTSVKVSSNGLMYSYEEYVRRAVDSGVTDFHVSVMAHTPDLYRTILGHRDGLELVTRGVRNLVAAGHVPTLDLIVKDDTYRHLADIVACWAALGARTFPLWLVSLSDRNAGNVGSLPRVSDMHDSLFAAFDRGRELGVTVYSRHIPRCMLPGYEDCCRDLREDRVLVVTPGSRFFLWESAISPNTYVPRCETCRYVRRECAGIRRDYLERHGDSEVVPVPPDGGGHG
jgi:MoaA/NifB/PqqE/SkfB family radical SAM enzyme